jgi:exopolysaccharide production protein ExoZ
MISVQYLRGIAALLVVIYHASLKYGQATGSSAVWSFGQSGVDLFFIVSGFIMSYTTSTRETSGLAFFRARLVRILPLYWSLSLVALAVFIAAPQFVNSSGGTTNVLHSFTLFPVGEKLLIQNGWTLSYEFWFYIVFALALATGRDRRLRRTSVALLALVAAGFLLPYKNAALEVATDPLLLEFVMGMAAFVYITYAPQKTAVNIMFLIAGAALLTFFSEGDYVHYRVVCYGLPFMLVFGGLVGFERVLRNVPSTIMTRLLRALGDSSYSLYLVHPFALSFVAICFRKLHLHMPAALFFMSLVISACVAGYLCYVLAELRVNAFFRTGGYRAAAPERSAAMPR